MSKHRNSFAIIGMGAAIGLVALACATVPVTGRKSLVLIPEGVEDLQAWLPEAIREYETAKR